jgi:uncharacterized protein (TIGR03067 family)
MRMYRKLFVIHIALTTLISCGCNASDPAKKDIDALQGTWEIVSAEKGGKDITQECQDEGFKITFQGDAWIQDVKGYHFNTSKDSHIKIDASKLPKEFDHIHTLTSTIASTYPGIYKLNGDTLTLCFDVDLKSRPTEFATAGSSGYFLVNLKRAKQIQ